MKINAISLFILLNFLALAGLSQAKEDNRRPSATKVKTDKGFQLDKVVIGGNFGAQFGDIVFVEISPTFGYKLTEKWVSGLGIRYIYQQFRTTAGNISTNIYGGTFFNQYALIDQVILHAEFEYLSLENFGPGENRINLFSPLVGGGYRQNLGGNAFLNVLLLYNLNDDINSPYSNPILRFNFSVGL